MGVKRELTKLKIIEENIKAIIIANT